MFMPLTPYYRAKAEFIRAYEALERWQEVRPRLYVPQCPYSQFLVRSMINAHLRMVQSNPHAEDRGLFALLIALLERDPPRYDPPLVMPHPRVEAFFFYRVNLKFCTILFSLSRA